MLTRDASERRPRIAGSLPATPACCPPRPLSMPPNLLATVRQNCTLLWTGAPWAPRSERPLSTGACSSDEPSPWPSLWGEGLRVGCGSYDGCGDR